MLCSLSDQCNENASGYFIQDNVLHLLCTGHLDKLIEIGLDDNGAEFMANVRLQLTK